MLAKAFMVAITLIWAGSSPDSSKAQAHQKVQVGVSAISVMDVADPVLEASPRENGFRASSAYSLTTNIAGIGIEASLEEELPEGVHLTLSAASSLGISLGAVALGTVPVAVVSDIGRGLENGRGLTYFLRVDPSAEGPVPDQQTIRLTLRDPVSGRSQEVVQVVSFLVDGVSSGE